MKSVLAVRIILALSLLATSVWLLQKDDDPNFDRQWATVLWLIRCGLALGVVLAIQGLPGSRWSRYLQIVGFTLLSWIPCFPLALYGAFLLPTNIPTGSTWMEFFRMCEVASLVTAFCLAVFVAGWALPRLERAPAKPEGWR